MHSRSIPGAIPPCGGVPYSKASSMWPKRSCATSGVQPDQRKDLLLKGTVVDADAAAAHLMVVEHQVVLLAARPSGIGIEQGDVRPAWAR